MNFCVFDIFVDFDHFSSFRYHSIIIMIIIMSIIIIVTMSTSIPESSRELRRDP